MPRSRLEEAAMGRSVSYPSGAVVAFTVIAERFDRVFGDYDCLGRFSNGEAIYRKRAD